MDRRKGFPCIRDLTAVLIAIVLIVSVLVPQSVFSRNLGRDDGFSPIEFTNQYRVKTSSTIAQTKADGEFVHKLKGTIRDVIGAVNTHGAEGLQSFQGTHRGYYRGSRPLSLTGERNKTGAGLVKMGTVVPMKVHRRSHAGTPRHIQAVGGGALQKSLAGFAQGKTRDVETARAFLREYRGLLRIGDPDTELVQKRYQTDRLGRRHVRFSQSYKGVSVWPTELMVHLDRQGNVDKMNGFCVPTPRKTRVRPVVSAARATAKARALFSQGRAATVSDPELIIFAPGDCVPRSCWKMQLDMSLTSQWTVLIDALTGGTLAKYPLVYDANVAGSGVDLFGATQPLNVWQGGQYYYLVDTSKPMYNEASTPPAMNNTYGGIITVDADNVAPENLSVVKHIYSASPTSGWLPDGVSAAYSLSKVYDFYRVYLNRDSLDDRGCSIHAAVRLGNWDNACYSSTNNWLYFGNHRNFAGALDVIGHEYNHGVQNWTAKLLYQDQTGAVMEAYSDFFGEMLESYVTGDNDWLMGTQLGEPYWRDLADPSSLSLEIDVGMTSYPSTMSEYIPRDQLDMYPDQDQGGVHVNCTIVSHAFYLLAEGMAGAIGSQDATSILYRALAYHLTSNAQFIDVRLACITSAEELFGVSSNQARMTGEAFDAVEIMDDSSTPEPEPNPPVVGPDAVLFSFYDSDTGAYFLGRREGSDPAQGVFLSQYDITPARASVSGDGELAVFVDSINDLCFIHTDGSSPETSLGFPGYINSVAMTPDRNTYGFVFLDENGYPTNSICIIDIAHDTTKTFNLVSPTDGGNMNTIVCADSMDFTADGRYIIYDALNLLRSDAGEEIAVWSIYAIDIENEQILSLVPPVEDLDIAYPSLSQTSDTYLTFDAYDPAAGQSTVYIGNLNTYDLSEVGTVPGGFGCPSFNGDDSQLIYSRSDSTPTGFSLWSQPLASDHLSPLGDPVLYVSDADFGCVYRRGTYTPVTAQISVSPATVSWGATAVNSSSTRTLTVSNSGTADLRIISMSLSGSDASHFSFVSNGIGQVLSPSGSCSVSITYSPQSAGMHSANLTISSNDPMTPSLDVSISGSGVPGCACDLNHDGRCDMRDWLLFGQRWGATNCNTVPCACDLNADGRCDMRDWLIFGQDWGRMDCP